MSITVELSEAYLAVIFCMADFESTKKTTFVKFVNLCSNWIRENCIASNSVFEIGFVISYGDVMAE